MYEDGSHGLGFGENKRIVHHVQPDSGKDAFLVHTFTLMIMGIGLATASALGFTVRVNDGIVLFALLADLR